MATNGAQRTAAAHARGKEARCRVVVADDDVDDVVHEPRGQQQRAGPALLQVRVEHRVRRRLRDGEPDVLHQRGRDGQRLQLGAQRMTELSDAGGHGGHAKLERV